jgi:hypothetical protein
MKARSRFHENRLFCFCKKPRYAGVIQPCAAPPASLSSAIRPIPGTSKGGRVTEAPWAFAKFKTFVDVVDGYVGKPMFGQPVEIRASHLEDPTGRLVTEIGNPIGPATFHRHLRKGPSKRASIKRFRLFSIPGHQFIPPKLTVFPHVTLLTTQPEEKT